MNNAVTPLDSIRCPLTGSCLVEAAAGTGKTYSIQNLTARLIVESGIPIAELLVVTFTDAAAAELRSRIRQILQTLALGASGGTVEAKEAERAAALLAHARETGVADTEILKRLTLALRDFDDATISTIHGFCQKVLSEFAFESGVLFSSRLEPDMDRLLTEAGTDFFRSFLYREQDAELTNELLAFHGVTVPMLMKTVRKVIERPGLQLHTPNGECADTDYYLAQICDGIEKLRATCEPEALCAWEGMLNQGYGTEELAHFADQLADFKTNGKLTGAGWQLLRRLHPECFREKLKKTGKKEEKAARFERAERLLQHPFFAQLAAWLSAVDSYKIALQLEACREISRRFEALKQRDHLQSFHDLLLRVHEGLHATDGMLATALRRRYRAGIIDEFQDTDPIQYEIFAAIFGADPTTPWFMVGDPRQAIYSFRGGDIATYRRADRERAARGGAKHSLSTNYRSSAPMIEAVNEIFAGHACPFADPAITFEPIQAPETAHTLPGAALQIFHHPEMNADAMLTECVNRCFALLQEPTLTLPGRDRPGVRPNDIAILVPASYMGLTLQERLNRLGIPAVFTRTGNIFASPQAKELQSLLEAVLTPNRSELVIRALAGSVGGCDVDALIQLQEDGVELAKWQQRFHGLSEQWHNHSFVEMFQTLLREFRVLERFPRLDAGERQLTNFLQLGELLQQESRKRRLSPRSLLHFLRQAIAESADSQPEEYEQLLETDRAAVKIMTVHASKGLEFPIVFVPTQFAWHAEDADRLDVYHNESGAVEYDLGADPDSKLRYQSERLQELLRLAYVAVTRAQYRCIILWGKYGRGRGSRSSAWDWLFRMRDYHYTEHCFSDLLETAGEPEIPEAYRTERAPEPPPGVRYRAESDHPLRLELPELHLEWDTGWQITSYTGLTRGSAESAEDYDDNDPALLVTGGASESEEDIFDFPGGTVTGSAWHKLLEIIDFTADPSDWDQPIHRTLEEFGLLSGRDGGWREARTRRLLTDIVNTPWVTPEGTVIVPATLPRSRRLSELEFHYGIRHGFSAKELTALAGGYLLERFGVQMPSLRFPALTGGFLIGAIDLVFEADGRFYLADWKSNRLGGRMRNFAPAALPGIMGETGYCLQYLLYAVALVKYLRLRLGKWDEESYEQFFGGVWYCFLRGMTPETPGRGLFFDRPPHALLTHLESMVG